ncbi:MAG: ABC transporter substrate-binding protein [Bacteroidota bacterium]
MNLAEELETLDPAFAGSRTRIWMTAQLFNGLVSLGPDLNIEASLAHRWEILPDGLTYRFYLRSDVYFQDDSCFASGKGRRMTADDVVYSFTRLCDPAVGASGFWIFRQKIQGLEAFRSGEASSISGFAAIDDTTFQLVLAKPFPPLLGLLAMPFTYVVPEEAVLHYGEAFAFHPVGTGPFKLYRWRQGQSLIMHRNPSYFEQRKGRSLPYLDAVSVSFNASRLTAFINFTQGQLDFIGDLDLSYKDEILNLDGSLKKAYADQYQFILAPQLNIEFLCFLMDPTVDIRKGHPIEDRRIRQAINYAIDRDNPCH